MTDLMQKQIELELEMHGSGILRFEKNNQRSIDAGNAAEADWFRRLTREFVRPMADAIGAYKDYYTGRRGKPSAALQLLRLLSNERAAYVTIKTIFNFMTHSEGVGAQYLANQVARNIEDEVRFTKLSEAAPQYVSAIKDSLKKRANQSYKYEHDVLVHAERELSLLSSFQTLHEGGTSKDEIMRLLGVDADKYTSLLKKVDYAIDFDRWVKWPERDVLILGAKLIDIFANNMLMDGKPLIQRGMALTNKNSAARRTSVNIAPTEHLETWVSQYKDVMSQLAPAFEPCVIQPRDWTSPFNGGYHTDEVSRTVQLAKVRSKQHLKRLTRQQMPEVYSAVNALQAVKWRINKKVLAVANEVRLRGLPLGMPRMDKEEKPICPVPSVYADLRGDDLMQVLDEDQKEAFFQWKTDVAAYYYIEKKRRADVREVIATIDQGIKFADFEELFFVYTLDFRSRVYAMSSLINPQGIDLQKAMLQFKESEPLGRSGGYWFRVQGANVWGWDKEDFDERVSRVKQEEFCDMCLDIAADPVTFTDWTKADKPWQFLAWCFEYAELLEWLEEGNEEADFPSRVAVAMDGSCSGIQHYSAMLRDEIGGKEVNLVPSDKPQDIYRAVSDIVNEWQQAILDDKPQDVRIWDKLIEKFNPVTAYRLAEEWQRIGVTRSMTKKPVMTLPYGSSQLTCRDSIADYLKDLQSKSDKKALAGGMKSGPVHNFTGDLGELPLKDAVSFSSTMTWDAIGDVVVAARAAMKYIKQVTAVVAGSGHSLQWETPLGFVVDQSLYEVSMDQRVVTAIMGDCKFRIAEPTKKIDVTRMKSAAAPNFVHSMDASHLMKAVNGFSAAGIESIAVIHDSFGTHAGKTEALRSILINSFVDMYLEHDVIKEFKEYNEERLLIEIDVAEPAKGNLDLEIVRNSPYSFG